MDLTAADLSGADLTVAELHSSRLTSARFAGARAIAESFGPLPPLHSAARSVESA